MRECPYILTNSSGFEKSCILQSLLKVLETNSVNCYQWHTHPNQPSRSISPPSPELELKLINKQQMGYLNKHSLIKKQKKQLENVKTKIQRCVQNHKR